MIKMLRFKSLSTIGNCVTQTGHLASPYLSFPSRNGDNYCIYLTEVLGGPPKVLSTVPEMQQMLTTFQVFTLRGKSFKKLLSRRNRKPHFHVSIRKTEFLVRYRSTKKSPNPDELTGESYQTFKETVLVRCKLFQEMQQEGTLPKK